MVQDVVLNIFIMSLIATVSVRVGINCLNKMQIATVVLAIDVYDFLVNGNVLARNIEDDALPF